MCGIIGYSGTRDCVPILLDGLRRLEYRGYDSAGLALISGSGDLHVRKKEGKIINLEKVVFSEDITGSCGIGHTRWATHGKPSDVNSHPHATENVAVVHNGIIENYSALRTELEGKGATFLSETDTEVITQHVNFLHEAGASLVESVRETLKVLKGSFAFAAISKKEPGTIVGVRLNCPLVVGVGAGEMFLSSDIPPLLPYTRDAMFLDDGEMVVFTPDGLEVTDFSGKRVEKEQVYIEWSAAMAEKEGYKHFMQKEIFEQPRAILDTLAGRVDFASGRIAIDGLPVSEERLGEVEKIFIVACGTSWHAGLVGKFLIEELARVPVEVDLGSEFRYRDPIVNDRSLCIPISQSGETADTIAALREARSKGASAIAICNVVGSTIARESDGVFYTHAGPEIGVASTKAFTTQLVSLYLMALYLGFHRGVMSGEDVVDHARELRRLPLVIDGLLKQDRHFYEIAMKYKDARDFLYLGRGINYPIALEGALKLKEISYIHAEGYPAGEMKHGPIALIDENMPVVVLAPTDPTYEKVMANVEEVLARGGRVIAVATEGNEEIEKRVEDVILIPPCRKFHLPIVNVVPLQLLAYHMAVIKGTDVDQPRNLAKSVTVE
ncbi:MAG: glutamine--fructose-6-phosphate transaminase (isomerizing) [Deltaproteobacteria bacterium]|nr:glutamine--fructose-6-phosphate transaminase (isomerizing) [Deltaproteobacteria bacterium]NIS76801.1 glutamine--fructose-6-phosphate transaminase (isomerizing) [Deltaproteobacteria bacterium]